MRLIPKLLLACAPIVLLAACGGGGDTADRLDVADPTVRFVHASPLAPNVTLFREQVAQSDATNVAYRFASNYFDVATVSANWSVRTAVGGVTVGTVAVPAVRGNRYTIVALPLSATETGTYLITDPYNKKLTADNSRIRLMNAAFNASNVDVYFNAPGTDIAAVGPQIAGTAYGTSGPASGQDSFDITAGTYQVTITSTGTKTILFRGQLNVVNNQDLLLLTVPDLLLPGGIRTLLKVEGTAGTGEIAPQ